MDTDATPAGRIAVRVRETRESIARMEAELRQHERDAAELRWLIRDQREYLTFLTRTAWPAMVRDPS